MPHQDWVRVKRVANKKVGDVWLVHKNGNGRTETGYFKYAKPHPVNHVKTILASELIVFRLANALHLPAAKIELAKIDGYLGIVSVKRPIKSLLRWRNLDSRVHHNIPRYILNPERLLKAFVFDIWVCNIDRHGYNVMVYPVKNKYNFYLIDHGTSLTEALNFRRRPWNSAYWDRVAGYNNKYLEGLPRYIRSYKMLEPYVNEIKRLPPALINKIVDSVPAELLPKARKETIKRLLFWRRKRLKMIVARWVEDNLKGRLIIHPPKFN